MNNISGFSVFGKIDLKKLYEKWKDETDPAPYDEPLCGWDLKFGYVFENDVCVLLFEHPGDGGVTYYRVLYFTGEYEDFKLLSKNRFKEEDGFHIDALGINSEVTLAFYFRSNEKVKYDICGDKLTEDAPEIRSLPELEESVIIQSCTKFVLVDKKKVLFIKAPEGGCVYDRSKAPHDFLSNLSKSGKRPENDEDEEAGEDYEDEENEKEDNDDTECQAEVKTAEPAAEKTAMEELRGLVGLEDIKKQAERIIALKAVQEKAKAGGRTVENISLNCAFLGNPGTAKTTAARIFARVMKENGILSKGDLVEAGRADLVAKYLGQTAIKVKDAFKKAKGSVLFIDEAYSLLDNQENEYGDEAIATIVQEMENNRDDMIVIFAGYPDKMEQFLSRNPGLRSRVPFTVKFRDYSADELTEIAKQEITRRGYSADIEAEKKIFELCSAAMKCREFGNGRFSRNLVESAIMNAAERVMKTVPADADGEEFFRLQACDFIAPANLKEQKSVHVLGFCA